MMRKTCFAAGLLIFFYGIARAYLSPVRAVNNPWGEGATTLEWTLSSPPPHHQFDTLPRFSGSAFDPNRGGILLVFYLAIVLQVRKRSLARSHNLSGTPWVLLILLLLLGTLSRSSVLAATILVVLTILQR